jgi:serine/threonine protein kinase
MAPEVLCKQMHSYEVDYYAVGIIAYELMMGKVDFHLFSDLTQEIIAWKSGTQFFQSSI